MKTVLLCGLVMVASGGGGLAWRMSGNTSDDLLAKAGVEHPKLVAAARAVMHGVPKGDGDAPAARATRVAAVTPESTPEPAAPPAATPPATVAAVAPAPVPATTPAPTPAPAEDSALRAQAEEDASALPRGPSSWTRQPKTGAELAAALAALDTALGGPGPMPTLAPDGSFVGPGAAAVYSSEVGSFILLVDRTPESPVGAPDLTVDVVGYRAIDLAPESAGVTDLYVPLSKDLALRARGNVDRVLAQAFLEQVDFVALGAPPPSLTQ